jgi:hypothetical protein
MNPLTGRFLSRDPEDGDPADPASLQKYAYADADPVNGIDPTGWSTVAETEGIDTEVELRETPKPKLPPGAGWGALALLGLEVYCLYESEHVATTIVIGANGSPQGVELIGSNCSARATSPSTGPGPGPTPGPGPGPAPGPGPGPGKGTGPPPQPLFVVRLQAQGSASQGDGVEESVVLTDTSPITVARGLAGLEQLKGMLTTRQLKRRAALFQQAANWISNRPPIGVGAPTSKTFALPKSTIRVDVEIWQGVNFQY